MRWFTKHLRNIGMASVSMLFLLICLTLLPLSAASAHEEISGAATPTTVTIQATPTEDATVTALNKELLEQEVNQLKNQNFWSPWTNFATPLSILVALIAAFFGLWRWRVDRRDAQDKELKDRQNEREKRAEERFQAVVTGLGDDKEGARIGAAILLRTFLHPGYEEFYTQTFDLAVANLRSPRIPHSSENPDGISRSPKGLTAPPPVTTLSQALVVAFKESFPRARNKLQKENPEFSTQLLDASLIRLDHAYLSKADLKEVWMPQASLQKANLTHADLRAAILSGADLSEANFRAANLHDAIFIQADLRAATLSQADLTQAILFQADLSDADLSGAKLSNANLSNANLSGAKLSWLHLPSEGTLISADLSDADLSEATLRGATLCGTDLSGADLSGADLSGANLSDADLSRINLEKIFSLKEKDAYKIISGAKFNKTNLTGAKLNETNLSGANIEDALSLKDTDLRGAKGLTKEQLATCKAKGAIIDGDPATNASQSTAAPTLPPQNNNAQPSSAPSTQESTPPPEPDESNTASSQQEPKS